jgi:hypothetical protein
MEIKPGKAMHHLLAILDEWRKEYHSNHAGDIIFQNNRLLSNVKFTQASFHAIQKHSAGFENIPAVIAKPDEVWSGWEDVKKQHVVLRNYLKFGDVSYLVKTRDGVVVDAFALSNSAVNGFRRGCLI